MAKNKDAPPPLLNTEAELLTREGEQTPPAGEIVDRVGGTPQGDAPPTEQFPGLERVTLSAPLITPEEYRGRDPWDLARVKLKGGERNTMGRLMAGLIATGETLANGKPVVTKNDTIRWLLQKIGNEPKERRRSFKKATGG
jgi:hypothetical protein